MRHLSRTLHAIVGLCFALSAPWSQAEIAQAIAPIAGMQEMPKFPPSSQVLQAKLNEFNHCLDNSIEAAANTQTSKTVDAVMNQCSAPQAQLQQMLPSNMYEKGLLDARQRVSKTLETQTATTTNP